MSAEKRISAAFQEAIHLPLTGSSRYLVISDCHRGTGKPGDNFVKNEYLYLAALNYYFQKGFTYLELGDGDELWENRCLQRIKEMHKASFELMERFSRDGRFFALYGNHDIIKRNMKASGVCFYSGLILRDSRHKKDIYMTHGHQADILNSTLWRLSRFLVRYLWRPLEAVGFLDPTSAAKNNIRKDKIEKILTKWARENGCLLITGHTHNPMIGTREAPYCNSGSCIHPNGITCIEIENRCLTLVRWSMEARSDLTLYAAREILGKTVCLDEYS